MELKIGNRPLGPGHPPLVIAEVGINHDGDIGRAMKMVDAVADAGGEIVKFQCHIAEMEMTPTDMKPGELSDESLWDIIKRCELSESEERKIQAHCKDKGLIYLSTPFSREAADRLHDMGVPAFKVGSGECNNLPLLDHIARFGKPVILSTGMNDISSIRESVDVIQRHGTPLILLHCTSIYPTPYEKVRLGAIAELQQTFDGVPVGLSDHSMGIWTCLGAVAVGACVLEKHFTTSRSLPGPDNGFSIEPDELHDLIEGANAIWKARGGNKSILAEEHPVIEFAFASVSTISQISAGEEFNLGNTWVKRPGSGPLHARRLNDVLGKTASRNLSVDKQVELADVVGLEG